MILPRGRSLKEIPYVSRAPGDTDIAEPRSGHFYIGHPYYFPKTHKSEMEVYMLFQVVDLRNLTGGRRTQYPKPLTQRIRANPELRVVDEAAAAWLLSSIAYPQQVLDGIFDHKLGARSYIAVAFIGRRMLGPKRCANCLVSASSTHQPTSFARFIWPAKANVRK
ncbi:hypothetical protein BDW75DRAFT_9262 [Aspergillus navahoensis]